MPSHMHTHTRTRAHTHTHTHTWSSHVVLMQESIVLWELHNVPSGSPSPGVWGRPIQDSFLSLGLFGMLVMVSGRERPASSRPRDLCWEANAGNKVPPCLLIRGRWQGVASQTKRGKCRAELGRRRLFCRRLKSILMVQTLLMKNVMLPA